MEGVSEMMAVYNTEHTAYKRPWSEGWYLIPDGKKKAPLIFLGEGPELRIHRRYDRITEEHINLITKKDRVVLLESINAGCFDDMWDEMKDVLRSRSGDNLKKLMQFVVR